MDSMRITKQQEDCIRKYLEKNQSFERERYRLQQGIAILKEQSEELGAFNDRVLSQLDRIIQESGSTCPHLILELQDQEMINRRESDYQFTQALEELKSGERRLEREQNAAYHAHQLELRKLESKEADGSHRSPFLPNADGIESHF
jgi:hypothetical protein